MRSITNRPYRPTWSPSHAAPGAATAAQGAKKDQSPAFAMVAPGNQALVACANDSRCPKGTICFPVDKDHVGCFGSNCRGIAHSTEDCGAGRTCILIDAPHNIHRCANAGSARLGQECNTVRPTFKEKTCDAGLECIAGKCRESCSNRACQMGDRCIQVNDADKFCIDDGCSSDRDCGAGHACVAADVDGVMKTPLKTCLAVGTFNDGTKSCTRSSCDSDQVCDMHRGGSTLMGRCRTPCLEIDPHACPPGYACGQSVQNARGLCYRICEAPGDCPKGDSCGAVDDNASVWACTPEDGFDPEGDDGIYRNPVKTLSVSELLKH